MRPNPLTDELTPEAKAELAAVFKSMKANYLPLDVDRQVRINRTWHLNLSDRWR